ncbi:hypothetical protein HK098_001938 [Nowakowskiella sp. JEL0407]|nr:hypothetical protein HK098_001938 [Nowakowskiella sp. JEL0407]
MPTTDHCINLSPLTGLKGISSLLIVSGHFLTHFSPPSPTQYGLLPLEYFSHVTLFFLISGFTLTIIYTPFTPPIDKKTFWVKRIARVAPVYWFALLIALPSFLVYSKSVVPGLIITPLFLQSFTLVGSELCSPLWQVSAFAGCYLIYPFVITSLSKIIHPKRKDATGISEVLINVGVWKLCGYLYITPLMFLICVEYFGIPFGVAHRWILFRAPQFFLGVVLGCIVNSYESEIETVGLTQVQITLCTEILSLLVISSSGMCTVLTYTFGIQVWFRYQIWLEFLIPPLHLLWIYFLVKTRNGPTLWCLNLRVVQYLGERSYAIYCLHYPILYFCTWVREGKVSLMQVRERKIRMGPDSTLAEGLFGLEFGDIVWVIVVVVFVSDLTFRYVERPARTAIVSLLRNGEKNK